jgi:uncharacterized membrane protein
VSRSGIRFEGHSRTLAQGTFTALLPRLHPISRQQRGLVFTLLAINVVVAGCAIALFVIGEAAFAAVLLVGMAFGLVGLMKLRRGFRSGSVG